MAKGIPSSTSSTDIAPLTVRRITRAPLVSAKAFRVEQEKDGRMGKYLSVSVKLALAWDSGYKQTTVEGDTVYDEATGEALPHLIIDGFVTLSGHYKSKLAGSILPALGFEGPRFFDGEDSLLPGVMEEFEVAFGVNGLGEDYAGSDWDDLPLYEVGGKQRKGEVEVPLTMLKVGGIDLLGHEVDLALSIKDGWNRIDAYLLPEDFTSLADEPKGRRRAAAAAPTVTTEKMTKQASYIARIFKHAGIDESEWLPLITILSGDDALERWRDISAATANLIRDLYNASEEGGAGGGSAMLIDTRDKARAARKPFGVSADEEFPDEADVPF